jgi:surface protein
LFNTADESTASSKWILAEDSKLTITYKIPFDAKTGTEWTGELTGDKILEDVLLEGKTLSNEAYLNYTEIISHTATSNYKYSPKITKKSDTHDDGTIDYTVVFNNTIPSSATSVVLDPSLTVPAENTIDLSKGRNGKVVGWLDGTTYNVSTTDNEEIIFNQDSSDMFANQTNLTAIEFSGVNTENVKNMSGMFENAYSFNQPINNWNVSKVTTMAQMFHNAMSFN